MTLEDKRGKSYMRRTLLILVAALVISLVAVSTASAITYGVPDNNEHPYVGLLVSYDATGTPKHRCSGTLLSPTVLLTAGHCTAGMASAQVWFDPKVIPAPPSGYPFGGGVTGTPHAHPNYFNSETLHGNGPTGDDSDIGVVVLDTPVPNVTTFGQLPEIGALDKLATQRGQQDVTFTDVGYGFQEVKPDFQADRERYKATSQLVNLRSALTNGYYIHTSNNPGIGGGTCFGDSGGPIFLNNTITVVGTTSFGLNDNCKGADFAYRTDTANAQDFIYKYLPRPESAASALGTAEGGGKAHHKKGHGGGKHHH